MPSQPRVSLAALPTPIEPADRLAAAIGIEPGRLFIKRDDLTGFAMGGNKVRKMEFLCAEAVSQGADTLVTGGGPQSNHARVTAAAAARLGLKATLLLTGDEPSGASGNLLLDHLVGADVRWAGEVTDSDVYEEMIGSLAKELTADGASAFHVTVGGSVPLGALGYVVCADELREQLPDLARVYVATGSAGTHAGLVAGLGDHALVQGVRVGSRQRLEERIDGLAAATAALAERPAPVGTAQIVNDHLGEGYGAHTEGAAEAILLAARSEGILVDPVYTGKAMAALVADARNGTLPESGSIVFLHTGGVPGLLSHDHMAWAEAVAR